MKKHIINQPRRKPNTLIYLRLPAVSRAEIYCLTICLDASHNRQTRRRRPLKRHRAPRGRKIPHYDKSDLIATIDKIGCDIQCIVIPDQSTTPGRSNGDSGSVHIQFISRVGGEMQHSPRRTKREIHLSSEMDNPSGCVGVGGIDPVGGPDPVCLEFVDSLPSG